jgi:Choice-of-anchor I domain
MKKPEHLGNLRVSKYDGDIDRGGDFDALYAFGGRSFAIWQPDGTRVFESGDQVEQIIAQALPAFFNSSNTTNRFDFTSGDRGPEPEQLAIGRINISDPTHLRFELYINNRNFNLIRVSNVCPPTAHIRNLKTAQESVTLSQKVFSSSRLRGAQPVNPCLWSLTRPAIV